MADWKRTPKIDAHIHVLPDEVIAANANVDDPLILARGIDQYVQLMEEYNISQAIIMPFNDPFLMSMEFRIQAVHQNLMDIQKRCGHRFILFADIDVRNSVEDTLSEFQRIMPSGAFSGIKIHPANAGLPLDGEYFDAVFFYAQAHNIPVEIHSYPQDHTPNDLCSPTRLNRVLLRYPLLRVSVAHLGGFQYDALFGKNVWVNFSSILPDLTERLGIKEANRVLRRFGIDRLIFATDYPASRCLDYGDIYPKYFEILDEMDFCETEMEAICHENIRCFLRGPGI